MISPQEKRQNAFQKFKENLNIDQEFMDLPHNTSWAKAFREKCHLSIREMGMLTGYSRSGVEKIELGINTNKYYDSLVNLWESRELVRVPENFQVEHLAPIGKEVPIDKMAAPTAEWRRCPICEEVKYFSSKKRVYCSEKCGDIARRKMGLRVRRSVTAKRPKALICPDCGSYIPNYRRYLVRESTDPSFAKAPADEIRRVETTPRGTEISYILRRLKRFLRVETDDEVQASGADGAYSDVFEQKLRDAYAASQEEM